MRLANVRKHELNAYAKASFGKADFSIMEKNRVSYIHGVVKIAIYLTLGCKKELSSIVASLGSANDVWLPLPAKTGSDFSDLLRDISFRSRCKRLFLVRSLAFNAREIIPLFYSL